MCLFQHQNKTSCSSKRASTSGSLILEVDWQVYAHYSGHQSYTKALLLLDKSGGSVRRSLEITSKDSWRHRSQHEDPLHRIVQAERTLKITGISIEIKTSVFYPGCSSSYWYGVVTVCGNPSTLLYMFEL